MALGQFSLQFSMRAMLWMVALVSVVMVGYRGDPFWAATLGMLIGGGAAILNDCLIDGDACVGASQLLVGALVMAAGCGVMFGAAYGGLVTPRSGMLDYVTFAMGLFAICYCVWVRSAAAGKLRFTSIVGYFAFVGGAFMLNHILFDSIIRYLR